MLITTLYKLCEDGRKIKVATFANSYEITKYLRSKHCKTAYNKVGVISYLINARDIFDITREGCNLYLTFINRLDIKMYEDRVSHSRLRPINGLQSAVTGEYIEQLRLCYDICKLFEVDEELRDFNDFIMEVDEW